MNILLTSALFGAAIGAVAAYFGQLQLILFLLMVAMVTDFATGVLCASLFKSDKTEQGGLESKACSKGLMRKGVILLVVLLGGVFDVTFGVDYFTPMIISGFIVSELISIIENCGTMGIPLPKALTNMVEALRKNSELKEEKDETAA